VKVNLTSLQEPWLSEPGLFAVSDDWLSERLFVDTPILYNYTSSTYIPHPLFSLKKGLIMRHSLRQRIWNSNLTGFFIIGGILLFMLCACSSSLYSRQLGLFFRSLAPSCSIGVDTATVTVQAWSANRDCQEMLSGHGNFTEIDWTRYEADQVSAPNMTGAVVCEMDIAGRHVTIRDSPASNAGADLCYLLRHA